MPETKNPIRKATTAFMNWCADTSPAARLERTIAQGVIGVGASLLANTAGAPEWVTIGLAPTVMAILAPIQAEIGKRADA